MRHALAPRRDAAAALIALAVAIPARADDPATPDPSAARPGPALMVVSRSIHQSRVPFAVSGDHQKSWLYWQVDYRLRVESPSPLAVAPADLSARVEADVSNSRVAGHAVPRRSVAALAGSWSPAVDSALVDSPDEARRCRERACLWVWPEANAALGPDAPEADRPASPPTTIRLEPGAIVCARLRLEHQHFLHGPHEPLLGRRRFELRLGEAAMADDLPMEAERPAPPLATTWTDPPADRLDDRVAASPPDAIHLAAHVPGHYIYHFPERPVRRGSRMRLAFWYLVAPGTDGDCRVRLAQYRDAPTSYKVLSAGALEESLPVVGRWTFVERILRAEPEATTVKLDFRIISEPDVGELWIDDVVLEPLAPQTASAAP